MELAAVTTPDPAMETRGEGGARRRKRRRARAAVA
jgi:hypothetical protein